MTGLVRIRAAWIALAVASAAALAGLPATAALADQQSRLLLGSQRTEVVVARFACQAGPAFVLDQSGPRALLRFEGAGEIWVLRARAGPRGDVYYRNDVNQPVLRATRLGGVTLYTSERPGGLPCAITSPSEPLRMRDYDLRALAMHLVREAARGTRAVSHDLTVETPEVSQGQEAVYAEATTLAIDGLFRLAAGGNRQPVSRIRTIRISEGPSPSASYDAGVLQITVSPRLGVAGRPSSARIMHAVLSN